MIDLRRVLWVGGQAFLWVSLVVLCAVLLEFVASFWKDRGSSFASNNLHYFSFAAASAVFVDYWFHLSRFPKLIHFMTALVFLGNVAFSVYLEVAPEDFSTRWGDHLILPILTTTVVVAFGIKARIFWGK